MTKEITKAYILQELEDKFKLREFLPEDFLFGETVVPTYDIEPHLERGVIAYKEISVTAGPAGYTFFTVPRNEQWKIGAYNVIFMTSGAYKVTGLYIDRVDAAGQFMYYDMTLGQTASYSIVLPRPVLLRPSDTIHLYVDDYTSTANLRLYLDVVKETIR